MEVSGSPAAGGVVRPGLLIDTKAYGKLRSFSGKEEDWTTWAFVARSYMDLLSHEYRDLVQHAELMDGPNDLSLDKLSPTAVAHGWTLYNVLVQSVEGRALSILMGAEANNGLQAWRMLMDSYEPRIGGRYTAMLMGIIGPQWQNIKESEFLETLDSWGSLGEEVPRSEWRRSHPSHEMCGGDEVCPSGHTSSSEDLQQCHRVRLQQVEEMCERLPANRCGI